MDGGGGNGDDETRLLVTISSSRGPDKDASLGCHPAWHSMALHDMAAPCMEWLRTFFFIVVLVDVARMSGTNSEWLAWAVSLQLLWCLVQEDTIAS